MNKNSSTHLFTTIECGRCATCCTEPIVPVTDSDVKRISTALQTSAEKLVRFYSPKEMEYDPQSDLWIKFPQGKRAMGLRKKLSRCIFLTDQKSCSINLHRPMTCRTFPYVIDLDYQDNAQKVELNHIVSCSCKKKPKSALTEVIDYVRQELGEDDLYYDKIFEWNSRKQAGTTRDFLRFIGL